MPSTMLLVLGAAILICLIQGARNALNRDYSTCKSWLLALVACMCLLDKPTSTDLRLTMVVVGGIIIILLIQVVIATKEQVHSVGAQVGWGAAVLAWSVYFATLFFPTLYQ